MEVSPKFGLLELSYFPRVFLAPVCPDMGKRATRNSQIRKPRGLFPNLFIGRQQTVFMRVDFYSSYSQGAAIIACSARDVVCFLFLPQSSPVVFLSFTFNEQNDNCSTRADHNEAFRTFHFKRNASADLWPVRWISSESDLICNVTNSGSGWTNL